jgi:hypothetical protein
MIGTGIIVEKAIKLLAKQFKLDKVLEYVENPNELDEDVKHLKARVYSLEKMSHPPRDFVICDDCKCKVVITEHIEERKK